MSLTNQRLAALGIPNPKELVASMVTLGLIKRNENDTDWYLLERRALSRLATEKSRAAKKARGVRMKISQKHKTA